MMIKNFLTNIKSCINEITLGPKFYEFLLKREKIIILIIIALIKILFLTTHVECHSGSEIPSIDQSPTLEKEPTAPALTEALRRLSPEQLAELHAQLNTQPGEFEIYLEGTVPNRPRPIIEEEHEQNTFRADALVLFAIGTALVFVWAFYRHEIADFLFNFQTGIRNIPSLLNQQLLSIINLAYSNNQHEAVAAFTSHKIGVALNNPETARQAQNALSHLQNLNKNEIIIYMNNFIEEYFRNNNKEIFKNMLYQDAKDSIFMIVFGLLAVFVLVIFVDAHNLFPPPLLPLIPPEQPFPHAQYFIFKNKGIFYELSRKVCILVLNK